VRSNSPGPSLLTPYSSLLTPYTLLLTPHSSLSFPTMASIRRRLTLWYVVALAVSIAAFGGALYFERQRSSLRELDERLALDQSLRHERSHVRPQHTHLASDLVQSRHRRVQRASHAHGRRAHRSRGHAGKRPTHPLDLR